MLFLRRMVYYLTSLPTLLRGVRNWPVLFGLFHRSAAPRVLKLSDGSQYVVRGLMDAWIVKETNLDRDYERHGTSIQDGWTIVDIGAGLGDFAIFAARRAPHGCVYAYEPAPDSAELLRRNVALNGIANVEVYELAVSDTTGTLTLDISGGVAVQYKTANVNGDGGRVGRVEVGCIALADVLADLPGGVCDFLKIDVEGAEYQMLLSLDNNDLQRVRRICLEYHEGVTIYSHDDLEDHLAARGWCVRVYPSTVRSDLGFLYAQNTALP